MQVGKAIQSLVGDLKLPDPRLVMLNRKPGRIVKETNIVRSRDLIDKELRVVVGGLASGIAPWPLYLHGEAGSGKTCAALCMIDYYGGRYYDFSQLCADLRLAMKGELHSPNFDGVGGFKISEKEVWQSWEKANLAVLDDFAAREPTDFQYDTLKRAVDVRENKPAVFICNLSLEEISRLYDDRIASRLSAGTVFTAIGDRRQK